MRRVLWLTQVFPRFEGDPLGGFLQRLARELPARGWEVTIVAPSEAGTPPTEIMDGVRLERFDYGDGLAYRGEMHRAAIRRPWSLVRFVRAFRAASLRGVSSVRPDLIHAHWWFPSGWVARGVARRAAVPWIASLHGTDVRLLRRWPIFRPLAAGVLRSADAVLPVSTALDREVAALGVREGRREVLPMPADATLFRPSAVPPATPPRFLVVARLTRQKRVGDAVEALAALAATGLDVCLDVAGDGPERARLEGLARRRGVGDRVIFHGLVAPQRVAELYQGSRAVVLPSEDEGYGLTLVEAGLCAVPGIGTRSGGITDIVAAERSGILYEVGDVAALAAAIRRLAEDAGLATRLGAAARERAALLTAGPLADRLVAVYGRASAADAEVTDRRP